MEIDNNACTLDKWNLKFIAVLHKNCMIIITVSYAFIAIHIFKAYRKKKRLDMNAGVENGILYKCHC